MKRERRQTKNHWKRKKHRGSIAVEAVLTFSVAMVLMILVLGTVLSVVASDEAEWEALHCIEDVNTIHNALVTMPNADIAAVAVAANTGYLFGMEDARFSKINAPVLAFNDDFGSIRLCFYYGFKLAGVKTSDNIILPAAGYQASDGVDFQEDMVFITKTGARYHEGACYHLRKSKIGISKKDAILKGYTPCKHCH